MNTDLPSIPNGIARILPGTTNTDDEDDSDDTLDEEDVSLTDVSGVGDAFAEELRDAGVTTPDELANAAVEPVVEATNIPRWRVENLVENADAYTTPDEPDTTEDENSDDADTSVEDGDLIHNKIGELHKGFVAPNNIKEHKTHIETDYEFVRTYYFNAWPSEVRDLLLQAPITAPNVDIDISWHINPYDSNKAADILEERYNALRTKHIDKDGELEQQDAAQAIRGVEKLQEHVSQNGRKLYDVATYVNVRAAVENTPDGERDPGLDALDEDSRRFVSLVKKHAEADLNLAKYQQKTGMQSASPIGIDHMKKNHAMLGDAVGAMFPFLGGQVLEPGGVKLGKNGMNDSPVIMDPFNRDNGYNQLRLGTIGSGKSFANKLALLRQGISDPDVDFYVIDPMQGFLGVNEAYNGEWVQVEGSETINPLEIEETPDKILRQQDVDPWKNKLQDVKWFFDKFYRSRGDPLSADEESVLMRAVKLAYKDNGITPDPSTHGNPSPSIQDVITWIENIQENPEEHAGASTDVSIKDWKETASKVGMSLEPFREDGEYANLSGETDLDLGDKQFTYIDLDQVSARSGTKSLMMQIIFSMIYQRIKQSDRKTVMVIDEAHKLFKNSENVEFFEEVFRHSRHFDLSIQLISQTAEEFFINESTKAIADQCAVQFYHRMPDINEQIANDVLGLNDKEIQFIKSAEAGESDKNYSQALLRIDDIGSVPLNIHALKDEAAVIDYDPKKEWSDLTEPETARIRNALDRGLRHRDKINPDDYELADRVEQQRTQ